MVEYHHEKLRKFFVISCKTSDEKEKVNEKKKIFKSSDENLAGRKLTFNNTMTFLNIPSERHY